MTVAPSATGVLANRFASELSEMAVPFRAEEAPDPRLVVLNEQVALDLEMDAAFLRSADGARFLVGNLLPDGATPVAQAYSGHQFGSFSPILGDGRALLLGEVVDRGGNVRDLHLKGSGRTPFARGGDGRAAIGPMLREYIVSEAMHALGIPTTRSLAVLSTGRRVVRDDVLPGAVLARIAGSHLRVGSFQFARATGDLDVLRRLADFAIDRHYPSAAEAPDRHLALYREVVASQARLVAQWMLVGFVHGVMNTDNMTISGETIDYGPCAFLDAFDPTAVYSSIDRDGRYAYGRQPAMAQWNLARLADALLPLLDDDQDRAVAMALESLETFPQQYSDAWSTGMRAKLGLPDHVDGDVSASLARDLLSLLHRNQVDYTSFFRHLGAATRGDLEPARGVVLDLAAIDGWLARWLEAGPDGDRMDQVNPLYIPRNHLVEEAIAATTEDDRSALERLLDAVSHPFDERPGMERYAAPAPADFGTYVTFCGT